MMQFDTGIAELDIAELDHQPNSFGGKINCIDSTTVVLIFLAGMMEYPNTCVAGEQLLCLTSSRLVCVCARSDSTHTLLSFLPQNLNFVDQA